MSGTYDPWGILTYDWTTLTYTRQSARLSGNRLSGACAMFKGSNGERLVAIAGGNAPGMEAWNPADDSVVTLTAEFPLPYENLFSYEFSQMTSVNENTELVYYESSTMNRSAQGIWKYSTLTGNWTKVGDMLFSRRSFSVLPIDGVSCPDTEP